MRPVVGSSVVGFLLAGGFLPWLVLAGCGEAKSSGKHDAAAEPVADGAITQDLAVPVADASGDAPADMVVVTAGCPVPPPARPAGTPAWSTVANLKNPQTWYASPIAAYVTEGVLAYQNANGGWPKNIDMTFRPGIDATAAPRDIKSMFDNNATTTQIRFLAFSVASWPTCERYLAAFNAGMKFIFDAQYAGSGGWPQVWPVELTDYSRRITYNDNAMVKVLQILRDIAYGAPLFSFVSGDLVTQATMALNRGVDCILNTQIVAGGTKTGWCAQHDEVTLLPAGARAYELPSQSGKEGAQVLAFLMTLDLARPDVPRQKVVDAVEAAVLFYDKVKILGVRYRQGASDAGPEDSWIEADPSALPIWARFYDLEPPHRPFFCDRDGIKVYSLAEVGLERRGGYSWYGTDPSPILNTTYPSWVGKWMVGRNVLGGPAGSDGGSGPSEGGNDALNPDGAAAPEDALTAD